MTTPMAAFRPLQRSSKDRERGQALPAGPLRGPSTRRVGGHRPAGKKPVQAV